MNLHFKLINLNDTVDSITFAHTIFEKSERNLLSWQFENTVMMHDVS